MKVGFCKLSFVAFLMLSVSQSAFAEARYDISEFIGLEGVPVAFNDIGQIVGSEYLAGGGRHAFLWENGVTTDLGALLYPDYWNSAAADINNSGVIVGVNTRWDGMDPYAVVWQGAVINSLRPETSRGDIAYAVNNSGQIVGGAYFGYNNEHAVIFQGSASATDLHPSLLGPNSSSTALDINDSGIVAGHITEPLSYTHAAIWENGLVTDLGAPGGSNYSYAIEINNPGQVLGIIKYPYPYSGQTDHPFLWQNGTMSDLGTLPGFASATPTDMNDAGRIVGYAGFSADGVDTLRPFLWENGAMKNLNSLIDPSSGWTLFTAIDINNRGQILGFGSPSGGEYTFKYVLLTPVVVPEPVSSVLFLAGAGLLGIARLRKKGAAR